MSVRQRCAMLKPESPFFPLFSEGKIPIKLGPARARLEGCEERDVYFVDLDAITGLKKLEIARVMSKIFSRPIEEVLQEISSRGIPLRKSQTSGTINDAVDMRFMI